jgi:hypothetical protein
MQRQGADPEAMSWDDFLCDFCGRPWAEDRPMVEGHRGSIICGRCLTVAYAEAVLAGTDDAHRPDEPCCLCLEAARAEPHWRSPARDQALACRRCIKQSAGVLTKDPDSGWTRPGA